MKLVVLPAAQAELEVAAMFYATSANVALGHNLVAEFERSLNVIAANPSLGAPLRNRLRRYGLRRFPYNFIYHIGADELLVIALAHQRRRPAYWHTRIK